MYGTIAPVKSQPLHGAVRDVALMSAISLGLPGEKGEKGNPGVGTQGPRGPPGSTGKVVTAGAAGLHCSHPSARHLGILWLCPPLLGLMQRRRWHLGTPLL